jgi:hypothetical protein
VLLAQEPLPSRPGRPHAPLPVPPARRRNSLRACSGSTIQRVPFILFARRTS